MIFLKLFGRHSSDVWGIFLVNTLYDKKKVKAHILIFTSFHFGIWTSSSIYQLHHIPICSRLILCIYYIFNIWGFLGVCVCVCVFVGFFFFCLIFFFIFVSFSYGKRKKQNGRCYWQIENVYNF